MLGKFNVLPVHDCFGTHPNHMETLSNIFKSEFISLYSKPEYIKLFEKRILQAITDNNFELKYPNNNIRSRPTHVIINTHRKDIYIDIPVLPDLGKLNLEEINNTNYIIN